MSRDCRRGRPRPWRSAGRFAPVPSVAATFFALGALATLSLLGVGYGIREARRVVRAGEPIGR